MFEKIQVNKSRFITYIVFIFTLAIVILNTISVIFPALLLTSFANAESSVNPFELGSWAIPFFATNLSILAFGLLYYRKYFPDIITKGFKFILKFEVSQKTAIVAFTIIVGIYITFSVWELTLQEVQVWADWEILEPIIKSFPDGSEEHPGLRILYVNNFLLYISQEVFQNVKIIPFVASLALVFLTYFLTVKIARKRFAGLVATVILLQSHTFLRYDTTATYTNFWIVFYLASLYLIYKKWPLSSLAFVASVFSKALSMAFIPMTLFFVLRTKNPFKTKIGIIISYGIIFVMGMIALFAIGDLGYGKSISAFDSLDFLNGLTSWAFQLRIDGLVLIFLLPITVGLFLKSLKGKREADSILVLIGGVLLSAPLLAGFTEFNVQPYRWIPLIVFFAIGIGTLLSNTLSNGPGD